jgi:HYR domain
MRLALIAVLVAAVLAIVTPGAGAVGDAATQPPTFLAVTPVVVTKVNGVRSAVVDYDLPLAQDTDGLPLPVLCDPPPGSTFPLGDTNVNCTATDNEGLQAGASFVVRVLDDVAPPPTTDVIVRGDPTSIKLTWRLPASPDIAGTEIIRYPGAFVVFRGPGTAYIDTDIKAGSSYRYKVASYDWAGNHAKAADVRTTAARAKLVEPQEWAKLTRPPLLAWAHISGADYYNVQLWTIAPGAPRKVLSTWPTSTHLQLTAKWDYGGKSYRLAPGQYRWYVWPGLGAQKQGRYGNLIGSHIFVVVQ